jgi:L-cysteine:1D-myo-inositol 2-amino-2-deoxy-alpha-D-glucopyranoside ligase
LVRLYNTERGGEEPLPEGPVGLYVCGITPYDTTHLGHAFTYVVFDVLVRALRARGRTVTYVQNVTDVDDDILRKAAEVGLSWDRLADEETASYQSEMAALNVMPPDHFPRASQSLDSIRSMILRLEELGHAYRRDGNVYFEIASAPDYGRLSRLSREEMIRLAGERGGHPDDSRKRDPLDFLLWQRSAPGEPSWPSPWSEGRPGWHIECSAMAVGHLGPQVTVHGGGEDLVFPHHESEIVQSEPVTGVRPFVRIWMHVGMVRHAGEKMSKSLGNLVLVKDLLRRYHPEAIRTCLLRHHYREEWEYSESEMTTAQGWIDELGRLTAGAGSQSDDHSPAVEEVLAALDHDFDTVTALDAVERSIRLGRPGWRRAACVLGLRLSDG